MTVTNLEDYKNSKITFVYDCDESEGFDIIKGGEKVGEIASAGLPAFGETNVMHYVLIDYDGGTTAYDCNDLAEAKKVAMELLA